MKFVKTLIAVNNLVNPDGAGWGVNCSSGYTDRVQHQVIRRLVVVAADGSGVTYQDLNTTKPNHLRVFEALGWPDEVNIVPFPAGYENQVSTSLAPDDGTYSAALAAGRLFCECYVADYTTVSIGSVGSDDGGFHGGFANGHIPVEVTNQVFINDVTPVRVDIADTHVNVPINADEAISVTIGGDPLNVIVGNQVDCNVVNMPEPGLPDSGVNDEGAIVLPYVAD